MYRKKETFCYLKISSTMALKKFYSKTTLYTAKQYNKVPCFSPKDYIAEVLIVIDSSTKSHSRVPLNTISVYSTKIQCRKT